MSAIKVDNLSKSFIIGKENIQVLKDVCFEIEAGDFLVIVGPSGCGKSTLLHTIIGLEFPTSGTIEVLGENIYKNTTEDDRSEFRKNHIGMVYQQPNWIKSYTVLDNLIFPLLLLGEEKSQLLKKAQSALEKVGMMQRFFYIPTELSSGQQQKIALARAIITNPEIIIADEPTGNLDYHSGQELMQILSDLCSQGKTIIMVTHDLEYIKYARTAIHMLDGKLVKIYDKEATKRLSNKIVSKRGSIDIFDPDIKI